jgi:hypothetical protein
MQQGQYETPHSRQHFLLHGAAMALIVVLALYFTNPFFNVLEDETSIVSAANAPVAHTLRVFLTGKGQHEHPPLSDLLLHFWLPVAGLNTALLRLPSILFYAIALVVLATIARRLAGPAAFYATTAVGALWPFGFHFGRVTGWYSFCFLLIALLTLAYLHFLDAPSFKRWSVVVALSYALVTSNYFGWVVLFLLAIDMIVSLRGRAAPRYLLPGAVILIAAYAPLWAAFLHEISRHAGSGRGILGRVLMGGFNLYSLFVSESVAPWYWAVSFLAGVAIALTLVLTCRLTRNHARRLYLGFGLLFALMAAAGIIGTKRLLFISGWLIIALGCAIANQTQRRARLLLASLLAFLFAVGWVGIFSRKYYSAPHFIDPWPQVADAAANGIARGDRVITNSLPFLFYLNISLNNVGLSSSTRPGWATGPHILSLHSTAMPEGWPRDETLFVRGENPFDKQSTDSAEAWLQSHCRLDSTRRFLRDSGYEWKKRFFPHALETPYRITVQQFNCPASN